MKNGFKRLPKSFSSVFIYFLHSTSIVSHDAPQHLEHKCCLCGSKPQTAKEKTSCEVTQWAQACLTAALLNRGLHRRESLSAQQHGASTSSAAHWKSITAHFRHQAQAWLPSRGGKDRAKISGVQQRGGQNYFNAASQSFCFSLSWRS